MREFLTTPIGWVTFDFHYQLFEENREERENSPDEPKQAELVKRNFVIDIGNYRICSNINISRARVLRFVD